MAIFVAAFSAVSVSAAQDLFEIVSGSTRRITIREIRVGQYSEAGDLQAEMLSILVVRGYTTTGSGGAAVTPRALKPSDGEPTKATIARNNTTVAQDGTAEVLLSDAFNVMGGFRYYPVPEERIWLEPGDRVVIRITVPADAITMNATVIYEETDRG